MSRIWAWLHTKLLYKCLVGFVKSIPNFITCPIWAEKHTVYPFLAPPKLYRMEPSKFGEKAGTSTSTGQSNWFWQFWGRAWHKSGQSLFIHNSILADLNPTVFHAGCTLVVVFRILTSLTWAVDLIHGYTIILHTYYWIWCTQKPLPNSLVK